MTLVYIIYCIIVNFGLVDIDNLNILLKTPHLHLVISVSSRIA